MSVQKALRKLVERESLTREEMNLAMRDVMTGVATPAQVAGFLIALRMKGESVDELIGGVELMRELVTPVPVHEEFRKHLIDTCGTGGDKSGLFNISTAVAFVVGAAGGHVAKHGNRSVSGTSGSADVLEAAGVKLELPPEAVARCVHRIGVGFIYAPAFHASMKHAIGPRREMGVRTIFNLLGPLTNPAGAKRQVVGVFHRDWLRPVAQVLKELGSEHVMVVHSEDGLDEISIGARTHFAELRNGQIHSGSLMPTVLDMEMGDISGLKVDGPLQSLALVRAALNNVAGPARDIVVLNAATALYVAGLAEDVRSGVTLARDTLATGKAAQKLDELASFSQDLGAVAA
ncbi:anthranilate phosphoribosyltransferase [Panacagrimonas perspica]|uniref:Anthranilate phosphoribosyltransferase n=1 Tax=Panacagrimonas perspica TaxID=381431 RepID=A0A4S3K9P3_9GAMM|nr:anthranilate phosphoribosyltransferase [Panacagrimonas perspica]TDU28691.1 anthranilate phosphoribosyltransferase [Panacagrimonas perspica]THD05016.1 anthranilate phosphoribosyltransferase [Panacagrimonas perspica]